MNKNELCFQRTQLQLAFENTAVWRQQKAEDHPNDTRNDAAKIELLELASTVESVPDKLMTRYVKRSREDSAVAEKENELRRQIGFHVYFPDATAFLRHLVG